MTAQIMSLKIHHLKWRQISKLLVNEIVKLNKCELNADASASINGADEFSTGVLMKVKFYLFVMCLLSPTLS